MNNEVKQTLYALLNTLESIEVHGKENLSSMVASIITLERLLEGGETANVLDGSGTASP